MGVTYDTDQLMTPCTKYFSGGSTLNGTPGEVRIGGHEFSVGRLVGCRSLSTESTLTALDVRI